MEPTAAPAPSPAHERLAILAAALTIVAPCAGAFLVRRHVEGLLWIAARAGLLAATPWVLVTAGMAWTVGLVSVQAVLAVVNVARAYALTLREEHPATWTVTLTASAACVVGLVAGAAGVSQRVVRPAVVHGPDMAPALPDGTVVLVDVRGMPAQAGDVVLHTCAGQSDRCIHRVHTVGPASVAPVDGKQPGPTLVPDHWVFVVGDNLAESVDSRTFGPLPRGNVVGRVIPPWP